MMQKIRLLLSGIIILPALSLTVALATPSPQAYAACNDRVLGFPTWYKGLTEGDCTVVAIGSANMPIEKFVTILALNIVEMLLVLVGYGAAVMLIVGGFGYMTSQGESSKMASAKTTITNAVIGLIISIMSVAIVNLVAGIV